MRKAHKERVDRYRKSYPCDSRSDEEIYKAMKKIKDDSRHQDILIDLAVSMGEFTEKELRGIFSNQG